MKTITLVLAIALSTTLFSQEIEVKEVKIESKINLAGTELMKYKKKKVASYVLMTIGAGLAALSTMEEEAKPMLYLGGAMGLVGFTINISSLSNLGKASKHLINYKD